MEISLARLMEIIQFLYLLTIRVLVIVNHHTITPSHHLITRFARTLASLVTRDITIYSPYTKTSSPIDMDPPPNINDGPIHSR